MPDNHFPQLGTARHTPTVVAKNFDDYTDGDDDSSGSGSGPGGSGSGGSGSGPGSSGPSTPGGPFGALMGGLVPGGPGGGDDDEEVLKMLVNYNEKFAGAEPALYRNAVIDRVMAALISHSKPNALMLGPAGVGKTRVVEEIARRIAIKDPSVPKGLRKKIVYEFNLTSLISGTIYRGMMEERLEKLIAYASDPKNNVILFIDEIHRMVPKTNESHSLQEVAQAFKPALARGDMRIIGATTDQEGRNISEDPAFARRFTRVGVSELNSEQTIEVLEKIRPILLKHYKGTVSVDEEVIPTVVRLANEHLTTLHRPDSALTLLDRTMATTAVAHNSMVANGLLPGTSPLPVTSGSLHKTAQGMHGSDAVAAGLDIEALRAGLSQVRGQETITSHAITLLRRDRLGLFPRRKPMAWMFAGTSGVGKTEVARQIARAVMGTEPIILDMSEFSEHYSVTSILGSSPGYIGSDSNREMPFDPLDANPYQVIVLDEFEKAHREVQQLFLSALDRGEMTMASGKKINFAKAIIIATTNAGRDSIAKGNMNMGFGAKGSMEASSMNREQLTKALSSYNAFAPELLGRFTWLVAFNTITKPIYTEIIVQAYAALSAEITETNPYLASSLPNELDDDAIAELVDASFVPAQGARPAEPAVREWIENFLDPVS